MDIFLKKRTTYWSYANWETNYLINMNHYLILNRNWKMNLNI